MAESQESTARTSPSPGAASDGHRIGGAPFGAGKLTRTQGLPQTLRDPAAAQAGAPRSHAAPLRAEPWLMEDEASAALGLSVPEGSRAAGGAGGFATSARPTWWEPQLRIFLQMGGSGQADGASGADGANGEGPAAKLRSDLLLGTVRAMSAVDRLALRERLESPMPDDGSSKRSESRIACFTPRHSRGR